MANQDDKTVDPVTGVTTTGHEWDGLKELNNPLPRWWLWIFYATIVWSVLYMIAYPAVPLVTTYTKGLLNYASRDTVRVEVEQLRALRSETAGALMTARLEDIPGDPDLLQFARAFGRTAYGDNCAPCHGAGGGGARGFPNLADDYWLWGGTMSDILQSIRYGIRSTHPQTRIGVMPAFGREQMLTYREMFDVAYYVRAMSKLEVDPTADLKRGAEVFQASCSSCHGESGKGNQEIGAPDLTNAIWLYGSDFASIMEGLQNGRGSIMPHFEGRLDETTLRALAVFVHGLGGGK